MAARFDSGSLETYGAVQSTGTGVTVPDATLLFTGDFSRSGTDLTLTGADGAKFVVAGYFETDTPPSLISPQGAMLTGDVVTSLAGPQFPGMYAQAGGGGASAAKEIGKVQTLEGSGSVVRANGVTETLKAGDPVFEGDVVMTGPASKMGIGFVDGTVFSMASSARMVLNSLVYDANGSDNSMLFSLVEGSFVFAAGQIAPTGDMKIQTPVATMGIRGTAPTVDIIKTALGQVVNFSIVPNPDDQHIGSYTLFDSNGNAIGTINDTGSGWSLNANGTISEFEKSDDDLLKDAEAINQINNVYNTYQTNTQNQQNPQAGPENNTPPPSGGLNTNPNQGENVDGGEAPGQGGGETPPPPPGDDGTPPGNNNPPPGDQTNNDDPPPVIDDPDDPGVNVINGTQFDDNGLEGNPPALVGTNGNDFIFGFAGDDHITALDGDDFVFGGPGDDTIVGATGAGDDHYDGGEDTDTVEYTSTNNDVIVNLVDSTVQGVDIGIDTIASLERFVMGGGNDTIIFSEDTGWFFDGGDGVDTIQIVGALNIDSEEAKLEAENVEILDLNETDENILTITASDIHEANDQHTLQIRGGTDGDGGPNDTVNLTSDLYVEGDDIPNGGQLIFGNWELTGTEQIDDITFDVYEFFELGNENSDPLATAKIEQGIDVNVGQTIVGSNGVFDGVANVGYYDATDGQGDSSQAGAIQAAGHNAINVTTPNAAALQGLNVLFLQIESNTAYGSEFLSNLGAIHNAVAAGMTLIIHDRFVENAESILPGSSGFNIVRSFTDDSNIDVLDPSSTVTNGPGGVVDNSTLDGGNSSSHGFAIEGTLPDDAELILSTGDASNIVTFSYGFGAGNVIYSTIPLDFYLDGLGPAQVSSNFRDIYAPNVVDYGAELAQGDDNLAGGPGDDIIFGFGGDDTILGNQGDDTIVGGSGNNTLTGGDGADTFVIAGLDDGIDTITDFSGLDALDLTSLLNGALPDGQELGTIIGDFVRAVEDGNGNVSVQVDSDGTDGGFDFTEVAVLQNVGVGVTVGLNFDGDFASVLSTEPPPDPNAVAM